MMMHEKMLTMTMSLYLLCLAIIAECEHLNPSYERELSDEQHFDGDVHNDNYDHEAFLGEKQAQEFDKLSPEESKARLSRIYDKIDKDRNERVTEDELKEWMENIQLGRTADYAAEFWKEFKLDSDNMLTWTNYKDTTSGAYEEENSEVATKRRWKGADRDNNGKLDKKEFTAFRFPHEARHMRAIAIDEAVEQMDKDSDGVISVDEYIGKMYMPEDSKEEYIKQYREEFDSRGDLNNDGYMDAKELGDLLLPSDHKQLSDEIKHLITKSDLNQDGLLSREEVLQKYDVFVGSRVTAYGKALHHDEF